MLACRAAICGTDVGVAGGVALRLDDLVAEELLDALLGVLAEVVVLQEEADLGVGHVLGDVLADDLALDLVVGLPAEGHRPGLGVVAPAERAGGDEEVRHLLVVEEVDDRAVGGGAEGADGREDLVLEHQLVGQAAGLGRVVAVVLDGEVDLAAVDPAGGVDEVEVGLRAGRDLAVAGGGDAGQREGAADRDRVVGDADVGRTPAAVAVAVVVVRPPAPQAATRTSEVRTPAVPANLLRSCVHLGSPFEVVVLAQPVPRETEAADQAAGASRITRDQHQAVDQRCELGGPDVVEAGRDAGVGDHLGQEGEQRGADAARRSGCRARRARRR